MVAEENGSGLDAGEDMNPLEAINGPEVEGKTVLYIEDNPVNFKLVQTLLSRSPISLEWAKDGLQGLDKIRDCSPDLILLDLQLPGEWDGIRVLKRVRMDPVNKNLPVVVVTGHAFNEVELLAQAAGCDAFLTKPLKIQELALLMVRFLTDPQSETGASI